MSCQHVRDQISPFIDGRVPAGAREKVAAHLKSCRRCAVTAESLRNMRRAMGAMKQVSVPAQLTNRLMVMASHERQRREVRATFGSRMRRFLQPIELLFDNMMRPLALPFAGGLFSAIISFSALLPNLTFAHRIFPDSELYTNPDGGIVILTSNGTYVPDEDGNRLRMEPVTAASPANANTVILKIDASGRVVDWIITHGTLTPELTSIILLSTFKPATFLGVPTSSEVKVWQLPSAPVRSLRS